MEPLLTKPANFIKRMSIYLFIVWTILIFCSLFINVYRYYIGTIKEVSIEARTDYEQNVHIRKLMTDLGGFYAPVEKVPPNPYLDVQNREIKTTDGKVFTLVNSAYMMRIIFEKIRENSKNLKMNKLTSLKYINPVNKPDEWEYKGLLELDKGRDEVIEIVKLNKEPYLRLLKPFIIEKSCLQCHEKQGYKIGDVRGGISISVPMKPYFENGANSRNLIIMTHLIIWILISYGIYLTAKTEMRNITLYEETRDLSLHDALTGLANRRLMDINFEIFISRAKRYGNKLSVILLDIDYFKKYNDTQGHDAGDTLLRKISGIIQNEVRNIDLVVRYGGEEFLVILPDTGELETFEIAERIRKSIETTTEITISLGLSSLDAKTYSKEDIIKKADKALYAAKRNGRNRIEVR
ncbi:MAG: diguanylate cyclase [bacterium]